MLGPPPAQGRLPTPTHPGPLPPGIDAPPGMGGPGGGGPNGVPEPVARFLCGLARSLQERKVYEVHQAIESGWSTLTNQFFKAVPWPSADAVAPLVDHDDTFLTLYRELAFRHVYSRLQPTVQDRVASWENYVWLFEMLLDVQRPMRLDLPNQWLWDIVDELIYQFQSFCQFRAKRKARSADDIRVLRENPDVFSAEKLIAMLRKAADRSRVVEVLSAMRASGFQAPQLKGGAFTGGPGAPEDEFAQSNTYVMLGYFSLIGLSRVHCLLSDYDTALRSLDHVDMSKKNGLFARVAACHVTLYYYVGFSYLMLKRYADAVRSFSSAITFVQRTKQYHTRSYQYDAIMKKTEQMYALLSMALVLSPARVDDQIRNALREKLGDKTARMQRGEEAVFEELFTYSCPKFIIPSAPDYDSAPANTGQDAYRHQLRLFVSEVKQQLVLPTIRSYLRLYTSISVPKLAGFLNVPVDEFRAQLLALKYKSRRPMWPGGGAPPVAGEVVNCADVEFSIDNDVVNVVSQQGSGQYHTDFFVRNLKKLEEVRTKLAALE
jgi:translation initiation factor 3 subunit L|eukprot:TRINITY_DN2043_c0_g6_i1.p2 TRINITY_DN2043_c0_g6~~TRINITY_DN2043_c0_g6_i1.p2  ORF type:complete len:548 (+),score=283.02 TRINITY_DN2043_c0_g6_i1:810-2453(+)